MCPQLTKMRIEQKKNAKKKYWEPLTTIWMCKRTKTRALTTNARWFKCWRPMFGWYQHVNFQVDCVNWHLRWMQRRSKRWKLLAQLFVSTTKFACRKLTNQINEKHFSHQLKWLRCQKSAFVACITKQFGISAHRKLFEMAANSSERA